MRTEDQDIGSHIYSRVCLYATLKVDANEKKCSEVYELVRVQLSTTTRFQSHSDMS